ncbi:MAG: glycosyltransferase family 4 protein [Thermoanaerobaculia bacterium]|nr:glycosyltransferase family 4 protein [Thermoanaerobaculia bacterium]
MARLLHLSHLLGWHHARLWLAGLRPSRLAASWRWLHRQREVLLRRRREPRLTVGVDVSPFWEPLTGIGWYLFRLLQHLAQRDDVRLRLYGPDLVDKGDQPPPVESLPEGPAIEVVRWRIPEDFSVVHYWLADRLRGRERWLVSRDRNDILFAPNFLPPPRFRDCPGALVTTVHDLAVEVVPETMRESTREQLAAGLRRAMEESALVLTDAEAVRGEIIRAGLAPSERVRAVHLAPASGAGTEVPGQRLEGLPERYVLHVGTLEPRKNLPVLLDAFEALLSSWNAPEEPPSLVLVGGMGWKSEALSARLASLDDSGWLHREGYADEDRLARIYRHAEWLVLASRYEGFGLPAVEAMAASVPLLLSDLPVLREIAGDAALYASAGDVPAWTQLLRKALTDASLRLEMVSRAQARSRRFDWRRTADETVAAWRDAARAHPVQRRGRVSL